MKLWRLDNAGWVEAACMGYESVGFSNDNLLAVPICQTGVFVLSDQRPVQQKIVYLPLVSR